MAGERREPESGQDGERGGRMPANVLKEIAGRLFPAAELKPRVRADEWGEENRCNTGPCRSDASRGGEEGGGGGGGGK